MFKRYPDILVHLARVKADGSLAIAVESRDENAVRRVASGFSGNNPFQSLAFFHRDLAVCIPVFLVLCTVLIIWTAISFVNPAMAEWLIDKTDGYAVLISLIAFFVVIYLMVLIRGELSGGNLAWHFSSEWQFKCVCGTIIVMGVLAAISCWAWCI
jgi:hypothetical protein